MSPRQVAGLALVAALTGLISVQFFKAAADTTARGRDNACRALGPNPLPASMRGGAHPDFALPDANGKTWSLAALRGRPVVLNFWATWCAPCVEEMPALEQLARHLGDDAVVLAVSVDDAWEKVTKFFPRGTPLSIVLDAKAEVPKTFGTEKYPETFLIDREGRVRHYIVNKRKWDGAEAIDCVRGL
jgi:peroxiredoxin